MIIPTRLYFKLGESLDPRKDELVYSQSLAPRPLLGSICISLPLPGHRFFMKMALLGRQAGLQHTRVPESGTARTFSTAVPYPFYPR